MASSSSSLALSSRPLSLDNAFRRCPRFRQRRCHFPPIRQWNPWREPRVSWKRRSACLVSPVSEGEVGASSWVPVGGSKDVDEYGGWFVVESQRHERKGIPKFLVVGASFVILLASFSHFYFTRKGSMFQISSPIHYISGIFKTSDSRQNLSGDTTFKAVDAGKEDLGVKSMASSDVPDQTKEPVSKENRHKTIPVAADSTQLEALSVLQNLNIVEGDIQHYDLCTRREYARWLVKANSMLERSSKHRIVPSMLIAGSTVTAFDDVSASDPDFCFIQAIGETGIVPSKLSDINTLDESNTNPSKRYDFSPDSALSRLDLISWKAQLEYPVIAGAEEEMLRKNIGYMDVGTVSSDALQTLFMDALADERSIARRVFGNTRRLQPLKPVTKAQAVVALTSGRMAEAVQIEISRLLEENLSRLVDMKDIRSELIHKGDIQRYWEERLHEERMRGSEVQQNLLDISRKLEKVKDAHKKEMADHLKERAALDCQRQLLLGIKEEIDTMHEKLANEKAIVAAEQRTLEELLMDLHEKQDAIIEAKSLLEAEKEALRILRSWVEDGARQSQFRAKVLEDALRRWKWNDQSELSKTV